MNLPIINRARTGGGSKRPEQSRPYTRKSLGRAAHSLSGLPLRGQTGAEWSPHFAGLNNVRAALEWCFGVNANTESAFDLPLLPHPFFWRCLC
jgi:hypothetical protein